MVITEEAYNKMLYQIKSVPPEYGGIIGGRDDIVTQIIVDDNTNKKVNEYMYVPDVKFLNACISRWSKQNYFFMGMFHSHPNKKGYDQLSMKDIEYINEIVNANFFRNLILYFPIVFPGEKIFSYIVQRENGVLSLKPDRIQIIRNIY